MATTTTISWTDRTANFWMGCQKVSEGCRHCYAEKFVSGRMGLNVWGPSAPRQFTKGVWTEVPKWNRQALREGRQHRVFVGSLMDWAEDRKGLIETRMRMWELIGKCEHLIFQLLTKRPENIRRFLPDDWQDGYPNVWLGTSVEDMRVADRVEIIRQVPAVVRFVSAEPLLGPLSLDLSGIHWMIVGGESGPGYRPMNLEWARDLRRQCQDSGTAFFFKQSSGPKSGMYHELDGEVVQEFPVPSILAHAERTF
jgi:protein gp37